MSIAIEPSLERIALRYLGRFPDLQGLARQAAGHVLRRQLGYWLDPDQVHWHEFATAASSGSSYTGWRHRGPPRRSLTLTELVMQRFSPHQQDNADLLMNYGGFYRVDGSHALYDERNELRLAPLAVLEMFWGMDFSTQYAKRLETFRQACGEDYCVLARARFIAAVTTSMLGESDRAQLLAHALIDSNMPISLQALQRSRGTTSFEGWRVLTLAGITARNLLQLTLKSGTHCLYLADEHAALVVLDNSDAVQAWLREMVGNAQDRERLMRLFVGDDFQARAMRTRLESIFDQLSGSAAYPRSGTLPITGDLFVHLREQVMNTLVNNAHEGLTSNAELAKAKWLAGLRTAGMLIAPMTPGGWPVALTSLGIGVGTLALHLDRAINGKSAWRTGAWWAVLLDVLFVLLDAALMRAGELFSRARIPSRDISPISPTVSDEQWPLYMRPAVDELLAYADQAVARQQSLMSAVPWVDEQSIDQAGQYLDAFSEPCPVYRDELGFGSPAIAEYSHSPERYNHLWRGLPLEGKREFHVKRSFALAEALQQIGVSNQVRLYRAASSFRGTGHLAFREGRMGVGDVLVTTDFTSFTENPYALWEVFNDPQAQVGGGVFDDSAVVYVLEPTEDIRATPIAPFSVRPDEAESLMMPGNYLRIEEVKAVQGAGYRFVQVRLKAVGEAPAGRPVYDMRTGEEFDRALLAQQLGGGTDDSLMRRFFPVPG
ncbi:hypothetical protein G7009_11595 [Pseudomonas capeferrum]|uniref:dermonecrotic toxin domain-containing protein n=1 Tax=Pseudomonas capeferrum TaxID=1495066 RepID=UPI0015E37D6A|nr:DUF6543 domain-containing protein [Pseudomonas capeferrum]MBA1202396.1 hypothetical protein [Pseudomonas capeferrum]